MKNTDKNEKDCELVTLAEAAKLLKCSRSLLYRLIEQKYPLPVIRVGTLIRFRPVDLIEFFRSDRFEEIRQGRINSKVTQLTDQRIGAT